MSWLNKINAWKQGLIEHYPRSIKGRYFYETSKCDKYMHNEYRVSYIPSEELDAIVDEDYTSFIDELCKSRGEYTTSFFNKSGDTLLVVPMPRLHRRFTTIKDFIDNASEKHQIDFWKRVAAEIENMLTIHDEVYVSTHGLGVSYFHLRICTIPKYYHSDVAEK